MRITSKDFLKVFFSTTPFFNVGGQEWFLDIPKVVVDEFVAAGFTWGGGWSGAYKDYMHFETGTAKP